LLFFFLINRKLIRFLFANSMSTDIKLEA